MSNQPFPLTQSTGSYHYSLMQKFPENKVLRPLYYLHGSRGQNTSLLLHLLPHKWLEEEYNHLDSPNLN